MFDPSDINIFFPVKRNVRRAGHTGFVLGSYILRPDRASSLTLVTTHTKHASWL